MPGNEKYLKLKYWRQKLGLGQDDMAQLLGYSTSNYSMKENNRGKFYLSEARIILDTFNKMLIKANMPKLTMEDIFFD